MRNFFGYIELVTTLADIGLEGRTECTGFSISGQKQYYIHFIVYNSYFFLNSQCQVEQVLRRRASLIYSLLSYSNGGEWGRTRRSLRPYHNMLSWYSTGRPLLKAISYYVFC